MKMDLEVTESMDLSPGDHQHLVQKAADDDTQTPFGQAYATPPAAGPRQTHGNPNTKANQRTDTYAVQISDEGSPDNSNTVTGLLAQVSVRRAFIIKVFLILSAQLVVTGAIINMFLFWKALKVWVLKNPWFTYALLPALFVVLFVLACCRNLRHQVPANYILRGLFSHWEQKPSQLRIHPFPYLASHSIQEGFSSTRELGAGEFLVLSSPHLCMVWLLSGVGLLLMAQTILGGLLLGAITVVISRC
ncbi:uncharacterized protein TMBIM7P isoform X2 [Manis javanica]|uniref:uncharacterized protein TMBIM7P isoform X2 n=1 Tax=Manis javanica TaxID=9974 RepID=UPI003C6D4BC4